jgi:hypothetical protein
VIFLSFFGEKKQDSRPEGTSGRLKTSEVGVAQPKIHDFFTESFFGSQAPVIRPEIFIS